MSHGPIPLKVTNSFFYVKNSVEPMPCVMLEKDRDEAESEAYKKEPRDHMKFLNNFIKNINK